MQTHMWATQVHPQQGATFGLLWQGTQDPHSKLNWLRSRVIQASLRFVLQHSFYLSRLSFSPLPQVLSRYFTFITFYPSFSLSAFETLKCQGAAHASQDAWAAEICKPLTHLNGPTHASHWNFKDMRERGYCPLIALESMRIEHNKEHLCRLAHNCSISVVMSPTFSWHRRSFALSRWRLWAQW
jgi:hypothetical protein